MRKIIFFFVLLWCVSAINAQTPERLPYQAVIRDNTGQLLADQSVSVQFKIRQATANGELVYAETIDTNTTNIGVFNAQIGSGTVIEGNMSAIDWSNGPYFLEIAYDLSGGSNYTLMGTTQLVSVPYSLHSKTVDRTLAKSKTDRDNMSSPAAGQLLFCSDCGQEGEMQIYNGNKWTNMVGGEIVE